MEIDTGSAYSVPACSRGNVPKARTSTYFINSTNLHERANSPSWRIVRQIQHTQKTEGETRCVRHCREVLFGED